MGQAESNYILIVLGIGAVIAELLLGVVTGFDMLIIGVILMLSGAIGLLANSFTVALIAVIILVVVYVVIGRKFFKQRISITTTATNADALIGKKGKVTKKITQHIPGQVKVDGEIWRAASNAASHNATLDEGSTVTVQSVSGVTLTVTQGERAKG